MADSMAELQTLIDQLARRRRINLEQLGYLHVLVEASIAQEIAANRGTCFLYLPQE